MDKYLKSALTIQQAEARTNLFAPGKDNLSYNLFLKLKKGESYQGSIGIQFDLAAVSKDLFLDYAGTEINDFIVNGQSISTADKYESLRDRRFLQIPQEPLKVGKNEIKINFTNLYSTNGLGLHSFVDTDSKQYIYSQSCPYAQNKIYPCFDQPDLKASLSLKMAVPHDWVAIANQPQVDEKLSNVEASLTKEEESELKMWTFSKTPRLSTYFCVFIAGPFHEIKATNLHKNIVMSCYCRKSLAPYLRIQAEEIFELTRETIKCYENFFQYPYGFDKYDSVFIPESRYGAMENPGAVTFNDNKVWREQVTIETNTNRSNTITHEAAHHWFGDLVTMKWWNDLWLNESFADFISHFCLDKIEKNLTHSKITNAWLLFFTRKGWGYTADQQRSTHPIAGDINDTDESETIFDGITYSKGAATLKQLMRLIGEENFGKAMSGYFKKFEWANATLDDFIASLEQYYKPIYAGSPASLKAWKEEWLQTAGLNECIPLFNPNETSTTAKLTIRQSAVLEAFPTLRHHKMQIAFFDKDGNVYESQDIMLNNTAETVIQYDASKKPSAVLLNYMDEAFIKVRLDTHSIAFFKEKISSVSDELTRAIVWKSLFDMVKDGQLAAPSFIENVANSIEKEPGDTTLNGMLSYAHSALVFSPHSLNNNVLKPKLFDATLKSLLTMDNSRANRRVLLTTYLLNFASYGEEKNVDNVTKLINWLEDKDSELKHIKLSVASKWHIVNTIHRYPKISNEQRLHYFNLIANVDKSDRMQLAQAYCEASRAEGQARKDLYNSFLSSENKLSVQMLRQAMSGYNSSPQTNEEDADIFFNDVLRVFKEKNNEVAKAYYSSMFPHKENLAYYIEKVQHLLTQAEGNMLLEKCLQDSLDDLERKRKGYLLSSPHMLKEFYNISL